MRPPPEARLALYLLHFHTRGLASIDDVVQAARQLDEEQLTYFRLVAGISYIGQPEAEALAEMVVGRLR